MKSKKWIGAVVGAVAILGLAVGTVIFWVQNRQSQSPAPEDPYKNVRRHHYDWNDLKTTPLEKTYHDAKGVVGKKTVDVSAHNGFIRWNEVASDGVQYAFIRGGYRGYQSGTITEDDFFIYNLREAKAAGIEIGIYFFSQAVTEAEGIEEARFVIEKIKDAGVTLPIVFDMEDVESENSRTKNLTTVQRTKIAVAFCEEVIYQGYTPMVYGNMAWLTQRYDLRQISRYPIWFAGYSEYPKFPYQFEIWQYTHEGTVKGIDTVADLNLWFKKNK